MSAPGEVPVVALGSSPLLEVSPVAPGQDQSSPVKARRPKKRKVKCRVCQGCSLLENCNTCKYCQDMPKNGGPGKLKEKCKERRCSNPSFILADQNTTDNTGSVPKSSGLPEETQVQEEVRNQPELTEKESENSENSDINCFCFAKTPKRTYFPAKIVSRVSLGNRVKVVFYVTGESAFVPQTAVMKYTKEKEQQLLKDPVTNRGSFSHALNELKSQLPGSQETSSLNKTQTTTMLGTPRVLRPVSNQNLREERPLNEAAFKEKVFLREGGRVWACRQCPYYYTYSEMVARRHAS